MKRLKLLLALLAIAVFLGGCGEDQKEDPIVVALPDDIVSLDSAGTKDIISETVSRCIYATLYTFDEDLNLVPCLAQSEEQISDLEWAFYLQEEAKFHDGTSITASDVKFSIDRAMSIELAEKALSIIDKVEVMDPYTIKVTTKEPTTNLPTLFVRVSTSVMSENALSDPDYDFNNPIGSGAFKVVSREEGKRIELERFDEYFLEPAKSGYLNFIIEPSEQNTTASLLNGNIDVVFRISATDCNYLKLNENVTVHEKDSTKMEIMCLNPEKTPLNDIRVREAIAYAIDKENIVANVADGYGKPLSSMIPPPVMGAINFEGFAYNPEKSRELLREAGYPDGFDLTVLTFDEIRKKEMEYIKLDLSQVGIRLNYEFLELEEYLKKIEKNEHMATIMSWTSNSDPDSTFSQLYSNNGHITVNHSKFSDSRVEEVIRLGKKERDAEKREALYQEANRIVASSYCVIPLYQPSVLVAANKNIGGVRVNPQGIFAYDSLYHLE